MDFPDRLPSPLIPARDASCERTVAVRDIIAEYRTRFAIDTSDIFGELERIGVYRCEASGYRFFHPFGLGGGTAFYEALEGGIDGYYDDAKWEHDIVSAAVAPGMRVLDIGCGRGAFLAKAAARGALVMGLEANQAAIASLRAQGVDVEACSIEAHAEVRPDHYDMVSAFQVLEHVDQPRPFLAACRRALKPGGTLILATPNDDGFMGIDADAILNSPPHHLGRWNRRSLTAVAEAFDLELIGIDIEPLNHPGWAQAAIERRYLPRGWRASLWYRLGGAKALQRMLTEQANGIAGHTIVARYRHP